MIDIREYRDADEQDVVALLDRALGAGPVPGRRAAVFRWKHATNPFGRSVALVAVAGDEIVGFRAFMRWRFIRNGQTYEAGRAVDTATDPAWQGKSVFRRLTLEALDVARAGGIDLIFNTPNDQSKPGYLKFGWAQVGTVSVWVRVRRPANVAWTLARRRGSPSPVAASRPLVAAAQLVGAADRLASEFSTDGRFTTDRSVRGYAQWRFVDAPGMEYVGALVGQPEQPAAVLLGRLRQRFKLNEFMLSELLPQRPAGTVAAALVRAFSRSPVDYLSTCNPDGRRGPWATLRFVPVPRTGIDLVALPLTDRAAPARDLASWRLSLADLEIF